VRRSRPLRAGLHTGSLLAKRSSYSSYPCTWRGKARLHSRWGASAGPDGSSRPSGGASDGGDDKGTKQNWRRIKDLLSEYKYPILGVGMTSAAVVTLPKWYVSHSARGMLLLESERKKAMEELSAGGGGNGERTSLAVEESSQGPSGTLALANTTSQTNNASTATVGVPFEKLNWIQKSLSMICTR